MAGVLHPGRVMIHGKRPDNSNTHRETLRARLGPPAALGILLALLALWVWLFAVEGALKGGPSGKAFGADFAMFVAGSAVLQNGGNPYDHALLLRTEQGMMRRQHLAMTNKAAVVRVGNPPLFLWSMRLLARLPFHTAAFLWMAALYAASLLGFLALLAHVGYRRRVIPSLVFVLMPPVMLGVFYGNPINFVFAAAALALYSLNRRPALAGMLLSVAWLKPPVGLPVVLLLLAFEAKQWRRVTLGFMAASAIEAVLTAVLVGPGSFVQWAGGLIAYSRDMGIQPDIASLAGLYSGWAPHPVRLVLEAALGLAALALTWRAARSLPDARPVAGGAAAYLWFVWLLATPYAHFFDLMLLTIPLLLVLSRDIVTWRRPSPLIVLYLLFIALLFINPIPGNMYLLPIPVLVAGWLVWRMPLQTPLRSWSADIPVVGSGRTPVQEPRGAKGTPTPLQRAFSDD